jgi:hypothetical protein
MLIVCFLLYTIAINYLLHMCHQNSYTHRVIMQILEFHLGFTV